MKAHISPNLSSKACSLTMSKDEDFARLSESTFFRHRALELKRRPNSVLSLSGPVRRASRSGLSRVSGALPCYRPRRVRRYAQQCPNPNGRFFAVGRRQDCPGVQFDFEVGDRLGQGEIEREGGKGKNANALATKPGLESHAPSHSDVTCGPPLA